jgi:hypothetical protein
MGTKHIKFAITALAALAALATVFFASPADAAKGGGKPKVPPGTTTIALVVLSGGDSLPNWGENVTFNISTTQTTQPWVHLVCSQNGSVVSENWEGMFAGSLDDGVIGLYSPQWTGGAADCTATVTNPSWQPLGSMSFHVYA